MMKIERMRKRSKGFTLIEAMVTVTIIGLIAAVAWPAFESQAMKNRRTEAVNAISRVAAELQDYHADNLTYLGYVASPAITNGLVNYQVNTNLAAGTYTIVLTAINGMAADAECTSFTLNNLGRKGFTGDAPSVQRCWGTN